jgi:hypothetical protein
MQILEVKLDRRAIGGLGNKHVQILTLPSLKEQDLVSG